jgi:hypothetical protein
VAHVFPDPQEWDDTDGPAPLPAFMVYPTRLKTLSRSWLPQALHFISTSSDELPDRMLRFK